MKIGWQPRKWLAKKAKAGDRGFPLGTVAFYGPDDRRASKVAVGIMMGTDDDPVVMRRWFSQDGDVRRDEAIGAEMASFLRSHGVHSVAMTDKIIGCPHEEGTRLSRRRRMPAVSVLERTRPLGRRGRQDIIRNARCASGR